MSRKEGRHCGWREFLFGSVIFFSFFSFRFSLFLSIRRPPEVEFKLGDSSSAVEFVELCAWAVEGAGFLW